MLIEATKEDTETHVVPSVLLGGYWHFGICQLRDLV